MKKIYLVFIIFSITALSDNLWANQNDEKIKMYALCTPSHEVLRDEWFLPSIQDDYEVIIENVAQECSSGNYIKTGWIATMLRKIDLIIKAIEENRGSFFVVSDVDIQFFAPTKNIIIDLMGLDKDMLIQKDTPEGELCAGFMVIRANEKTYCLWNIIKKRMIESHNQRIHDQKILNDLLVKKNNPYNLLWDYLPNKFFGGGTLTGYGWTPGCALPIPKDIVMHHANWTIGIDNKIKQLRYVKDKIKKLKDMSN